MNRFYHFIVCGLLVFCASTQVHSEALDIGAELNLNNDMLWQGTTENRDQEQLRLMFSKQLEKGSLDAHLVFTTGLTPLDPSSSFKNKSRVLDLYTNYVGSMTQSILSANSTQDSTPNSSVDSTQSTASDPATQLLMQKNLERLYYSSFYARDKFVLDRLQWKYLFSNAEFSIGRQVLGWGTGYGWNPTDLWNVKNPLDPKASKIGSDALRFLWNFSELGTIDLVAVPGTDPSLASVGARAKFSVNGTDFSFSLARFSGQDRLLLGVSNRLQFGYDLAGQFGDGIGYWVEGAVFNKHQNYENAFQMDSVNTEQDIGLEYTFSEGTTLSMEYNYNGLGALKSSSYNEEAFVNLTAGEISGFARHYGMIGLNRDFYSSWNASFYSLLNLVDGSFAVIPVLSWQALDDLKLELMSNIFVGDLTSEYGSYRSTVSLKALGWM